MKGAAPLALSNYAPSTYQPPVLDVVLSGTLQLHVQQEEIVQLELTDTGFRFGVNDDIPFLITFVGSEKAEVYDLGDGASKLTVSLLEQGQPYLTFTSLGGSLSYEGEAVRFAARLEDEQGYPLLLSGRLTFPETASEQALTK